MNVRRLVALALALMTACACQGNQERTPNTAPSVSRAAVSGSSSAPALEVSNEMLRHEVIGLSLRDAVARADLTAAQRLARQLASADRERSGLSSSASKFPDYTERLDAMRAAAKAMEGESASGDVKRAGAALGAVAKTCGDCHARLVGPTRVEVATRAPKAEAGVAARMQRHAWAVNELWNGIVGNSEVPWREGANVLADPALKSAELVPAKTTVPEIDAFARAVESLGKRALPATDSGVRASLYGEVMATCGGCHERTRSGGGPLRTDAPVSPAR